MRTRNLGWAVVGAVGALLAAGSGLAVVAVEPDQPDGGGAEPVVVIETLSNRADVISGGNALVEVHLPPGVSAGDAVIDVDGRDVTDAFAVPADGRYAGRFVGIVEGLELGENVLTVTLPDGSGAHLKITNHPIGGPVFSGPQIQPWTCTGLSAGLEADQCNREPTYSWHYKPEGSSSLSPYDPENPPDDVDTTVTDEGHEVPFIVRQETGVMARDEYRIAVLYDPDQPWEPLRPQEGFNHKLLVTHGASCNITYRMGSAPGVLDELALSRGFAVMSHALNNAGHNCNIVTQAESMIMAKEHLIETYGEVRYTIGTGCSGGALTQQQVANAYPGFYQGILPACSFTDAFSSGMQREDYTLLRRYFEDPTEWGLGVAWLPHQMGLLYDHPNVTNPITFTTLIPGSANPSRSCTGVPDEDVYHRDDNPDGVRCSIQDYMVNVFGLRDGEDKARRPADNVGIQYGLQALLDGLITPAQFVDVNEKIGSHDIDYFHQYERREAEPHVLERAYRSGAVNVANNMDEVAIIDLRGPDPGVFHDVYRTFALRERLIREHGHADNQIIWRGPVIWFGDPSFSDDGLLAMDRWLAAVEADSSDRPLAEKIVANRPDEVDHRCTDGTGTDVPMQLCDALVESYGTPRFQAGMPLADDTLKCQLRPLDRFAYGTVLFTDDQWERLRATFPSGVCDYTKPGVDAVGTVPWQTYADTVGGRAMGDPPASAPFGPPDDGPGDPDPGDPDPPACREVGGGPPDPSERHLPPCRRR